MMRMASSLVLQISDVEAAQSQQRHSLSGAAQGTIDHLAGGRRSVGRFRLGGRGRCPERTQNAVGSNGDRGGDRCFQKIATFHLFLLDDGRCFQEPVELLL